MPTWTRTPASLRVVSSPPSANFNEYDSLSRSCHASLRSLQVVFWEDLATLRTGQRMASLNSDSRWKRCQAQGDSRSLLQFVQRFSQNCTMRFGDHMHLSLFLQHSRVFHQILCLATSRRAIISMEQGPKNLPAWVALAGTYSTRAKVATVASVSPNASHRIIKANSTELQGLRARR